MSTRVAGRRSWAWRYRRLLFLVWLIGSTAVAGVVYVITRVPLPAEHRQVQTTLLTDSGGRPLASLDNGVDRVVVPIDRVPPSLVDAVVSTEDRSFFKHRGVDPVGLARATVADVAGRRAAQGGSTITQQYVKNVYVGSQRTLWRKLREAALALKLERKYSKREILERYLNEIYFGRGAYGVQAASQAYFGKDVGALSLAESSYLAGLIRSPESADATRAPAAAEERRALTLRAMVRDHRISSGQATDARRTPVSALVLPTAPSGDRVTEPEKGTQYYVDAVRRQLLERFGESLVFTGGLRVRTSLDLDLQAKAWDAVNGYLRDGEPAGALVAIDEQGQVKAMVGGRDWSVSKVNLAMGRDGGGTGRQAGSTFKPFLLAEAVKEGYSVQSTLPGPATVTLPKADNGRDYPVTNYEDEDYGSSVSLVDATAQSVNTVYAQLETVVGPAKLAAMASQLGITSPLQPDASLVLGSAEVSVLELAGAYSTLANRGVRIDPQLILEVTTPTGAVLYRSQPTRTRVLDARSADVVTYCLRQVVAKGTGTGAQFGRPAAGKTGTTEDYGDAWFVGYTPKLTTAVWMGWPEGASRKMLSVRGRRVNGGSFPATIWRRFMSEATAGTPVDSFVEPQSLSGRAVRGVRAILPTSTTTTSTSGSTSGSISGSSTSTPKPGAPGSTPTTPATTIPKPGSTTSTTGRPTASTTATTPTTTARASTSTTSTTATRPVVVTTAPP